MAPEVDRVEVGERSQGAQCLSGWAVCEISALIEKGTLRRLPQGPSLIIVLLKAIQQSFHSGDFRLGVGCPPGVHFNIPLEDFFLCL